MFPALTGYEDLFLSTFLKKKLSISMRRFTRPIQKYFLYFFLDFLSGTFTIHRTTGEGRGYLFNPSLPFPPASQTIRH